MEDLVNKYLNFYYSLFLKLGYSEQVAKLIAAQEVNNILDKALAHI